MHGLIEQHQQEPIFPLTLYRRGPFLVAVLRGIGWNFAQAAVQLQTSSFWQVVQQLRTSQVALAQVPLLVCFGALAVTALAVAVLLAVSVELVGKGTGPRASAEGG